MKLRYVFLLALLMFLYGGGPCWQPVAMCQTSSLQIVEAVNDSVIHKIESNLSGQHDIEASVKNTSNSSVLVYVHEIEKSIAVGHKMNFCFAGQCIPSKPDVLVNNRNDTTRIAAGATLDGAASGPGFHIQYYPESKNGVTTARYRFENHSDNRDYVDMVLKVEVANSVSISKSFVKPSADITHAYPNPANHAAQFNYTLPPNFRNAYIKVYDVLGKEMAHYVLDDPHGNIQLNLKNYNSGIYFYSLVVDSKKVLTRRLIVNKS